MKKILVVLTSLLSGCTAVQSVPINGPSDTGSGQTYYLPTTRILLLISYQSDPGSLTVQASQPEYIADQAHGFASNSVWSLFNSDTYEIKTDSRGLLSSVDMKSSGQVDEAFVNLAKSAGAVLESSVSDDESIIFSEYIDIGELADSSDELTLFNNKIRASLQGSTIRSALNVPELGEILDGPQSPLVLEVRRETSVAPEQSAAATQPNCGRGICYRRLVPYILTARFADGTQRSSLIEVPNGSPTYSAAIKRGAFTDWNTTATLTNGMLTGYKAENGSEIAEVLLLPFEMIGGAIAGITQHGQLFTSQSTRLKNEAELEKTRQEIATARAEDKVKLESSIAAEPLFAFTVGAPQSRLQDYDASSVDPGTDGSSRSRTIPSKPGES